MKAGILTFHQADNYGAVLQAYALQTALARLGVESEFVSFRGDGERPGGSPAGESLFARRLWAEQAKRAALFARFREERLVCAEPVPKERAEELNDRYDVFIAGSDQIWNPTVPGADGRYFLPFAAPDKRIAYAASFGMDDIPDGRRERYARQLEGFRALSVRERRGRELIRELTGRDCPVCLDPVLLLERQDWAALPPAEKQKPAGLFSHEERESYAFLHMVQFDQGLLAGAQAFAAEQELELSVTTAGYTPQLGAFSWSAWSGTGAEDWVGLIRDAECVFTDSYHAAALALIFDRPVFVSPPVGPLGERSGRVRELIRYAGLDLREGPAAASAEFAPRLESSRQASMDYLREAVLSAGKGDV